MVGMRALFSFLMLLGALSALLLGATSGTASAETAPCHETVATNHHDTPATEAPDQTDPAMSCCIACVGAPTLSPRDRPRIAAVRAPGKQVAPQLPPGLSPAPEPGPPR